MPVSPWHRRRLGYCASAVSHAPTGSSHGRELGQGDEERELREVPVTDQAIRAVTSGARRALPVPPAEPATACRIDVPGGKR